MKIEYINWNGERKTWDTTTERYFVLFDAKLVSKDGSLICDSSSLFSNTVAGVRHNITAFLIKNPNFVADWRAVNARIVKAPCAFDARQIHILIEVL